MDYSTFYESSINVSGLPEMPSLVRIDREAITIAEHKSIVVKDIARQMFGTGEIYLFSYMLHFMIFLLAITSEGTVFLSGLDDGSLVRVVDTGNTNTGMFSTFKSPNTTHIICVLVDWYGMGSWMERHGSMCMHDKNLAIYVEFTLLGKNNKGIWNVSNKFSFRS